MNLRGKQNRVIRHCLAHTTNDTNFCQVTWICSQMPWKWRKSNTFTSTQKTRGLWKECTAEKLLKIKFCTHIVNLRSNFQKKNNDLQNYSKYGQHFVKVIWRSNLTCWHNLPKVAVTLRSSQYTDMAGGRGYFQGHLESTGLTRKRKGSFFFY